jgi:acyl-CoA synthetase (AMP-forming)/AMP-acid ligase II
MIHRSPYPDIEIPAIPLHALALQQAREQADKPALIDGASGAIITYAALEQQVRRTAAGLANRGLRKGDVVALVSPNLPDFAVAFHGVTAAGGVVTTMNPLSTAHELAGQLLDSGAVYLVTVPALLETSRAAAAGTRVREIFVFGDVVGATPFAALLAEDGPWPEVGIDPAEDLAVLPYSSGTTGLQKGVMLTHRNIVAQFYQCEGIVPLDADATMIAVLPFFHIYGMTVFLALGLAHGATIVSMPRFDFEQFLTLIQRHRVTQAMLVPPIILALAKHPLVAAYNLSSLRWINSGAAPLGADLAREASERTGCQVNQGYGMTEASPITHVTPPSAPREGASGVCIRNTEAMVVDITTGRPLGPGEQGEIWVRGPQVMQGYLNNPAATAATLTPDGWLRTGDIGYADADGYFYIVDRLKELIKYKGYQVAPAELEALLLTHPAVADAAVIGIPDEEAGELPKAYIVPRGDVSAEEILRFVNERVSPHKRIRALEFVEQVPKAASGKILRRVLVERERATAGA